jgi:hypothetical protein
MSYKINYKVANGFLRVEITGTGGNKNLSKMSADVNEIVRTYGVTKILIDITSLDNKLGIFESLDHIEKYPAEMKERSYAIVDKTENKNQNSFFENAAVNRGYSIYFFYKHEDALEWLNVKTESVMETVLEKEY